jgi:hypothetical protein
MPLFARIRSLRDSLLRRHRLDDELDEELRAFVEELTDRHVRRGLTPEVARLAALSELGGMEHVKEQVRDARIGNGVETTLADVRYAWRGLRRTPAFAIVAVLTLGLGIGATTAIFSMVHALLLDELPFPEGRQLVFVWHDLSARGYPRAPLAGPGSKTCASGQRSSPASAASGRIPWCSEGTIRNSSASASSPLISSACSVRRRRSGARSPRRTMRRRRRGLFF